MENNIKFVILAAGKGTRMESDLPKALAPLVGKPMIVHLVESLRAVSMEKPVVIIGHKGDLIRQELGDSAHYVLQNEPLGTGHALSQAQAACGSAKNIVVLSSDQPLIKSNTILECITRHNILNAKITFTTTEVNDFEDWRKYFLTHGRILRQDNEVQGIREYKDATDEEKNIKEVNTGCCYVFDSIWLWENIKNIKNTNAKGEYYLTDLIELASKQNHKIETLKIDAIEALGANSKEELEMLQKFAV